MAKKGGAGGVLLKVFLILLFIVLLANFHWDGKPLYKVLFPSLDSTVKQTVEKVEETTKSGLEKAKEGIVETTQDIKEKVAGEGATKSEFPKEDREKLDRIIKDAEKKK